MLLYNSIALPAMQGCRCLGRDGLKGAIMNNNDTNGTLGAQKELAREMVKAVADIFALKLLLASTGREED